MHIIDILWHHIFIYVFGFWLYMAFCHIFAQWQNITFIAEAGIAGMASFLSFFLRSRWRKSASWFWMDFEKARFVSTNPYYVKVDHNLTFVSSMTLPKHVASQRRTENKGISILLLVETNLAFSKSIQNHDADFLHRLLRKKDRRGILYHISFINRHVCVSFKYGKMPYTIRNQKHI
jgi:hypothetical protein